MNDGTSVQLILDNNIVFRTLRTAERVNSYIETLDITSLSGPEREIISYLYSKNRINTKIASDLLGKGRTYVNRILKKLSDEEVLIWHGTGANDPTQYYTLNLKSIK